MTDKEYKQKKHECWEEYKRTDLDGEVQWQPVSRYDVFCAAFNRAYALGKQEKDADTLLWSRLTEDEKREMQCRYHTNECVLRDHRKRTGDKAQSKAVARMKLLENLFGKDNLKVDNK